MIGMVTAITPRALVDECIRRGVSKEKLLGQAGLSRDFLDLPKDRIPLDAACGLWEAAPRLTGQEMLGLHAAENVPFGTYRLLDYVFAVSATPKEALISSSRAFGMVNTAFTLSFRVQADQACLELQGPGQLRELPRAYVEYILAIYLMRLRIIAQVNCKPAEVHVTYGPAQPANEYHRVFGAHVRFRQPVNRLVFPRHLMELRNPFADPELCEMLEFHAQQRAKRVSGGKHSLNEVREALGYNLKIGKTALTDLSLRLAMSPRSLQREISLNGITFRALLDQARQELALTLLQDQELPLAEVAARLCYSDATAFSRAFQRWTGESPRQHGKNGT